MQKSVVPLFLLLFLFQVSDAVWAQQPKNVEAESMEAPDLDLYRPQVLDTLKSPAVIAFGSCNKTRFPQTMFDDVAANNPNLWIWLGDIVYADTTDVREIAREYKKLKTSPEYQRLIKKTAVVGIWDDHDYGMNDGDKNHPTKKGSQKVLMDFLDVPRNSPARRREGAYQSYTFGKGTQSVKIILLDTRYFRDELEEDPSKERRYFPNENGDVLGEAQWRWLEQELRNSKANLNILCSSIQVLSCEHPFEKWENFPKARKRLLSLIVSTKPKNLMILSGDRHMAEISRMDIIGLPYPLFDITASGMTHTRPNKAEPNKFRQGEYIVKKNFAVMQISWVNDRPLVNVQIRGPQNELFRQETIQY